MRPTLPLLRPTTTPDATATAEWACGQLLQALAEGLTPGPHASKVGRVPEHLASNTLDACPTVRPPAPSVR